MHDSPKGDTIKQMIIRMYQYSTMIATEKAMFDGKKFPVRHKNRNAGLNNDIEKQNAFLDMLRYLNAHLQERLTTKTTYSNIAAFIDLSNYVMEVIRHVVTNRKLVKEAENIMINSEVKSYSRKLTEEGIAQGIAEGKAQGIAEGKAEGEDFILKIIRQLSEQGLFDVIAKLSRREISAMDCAKKYNLML